MENDDDGAEPGPELGAEQAQAAPVPPQYHPIEEWAKRLSLSDHRIELLSAFVARERAAQRFGGSADELAQRFDTFCNQPA